KNIWEAAFKGGIEFKNKFEQNIFYPFKYEVIHFKAKRIIFRENDLNLQMLVHEDLRFRTVKKIILLKMKKNDFWIKFLLNEKMFNNESRITDLYASTELIKMVTFEIQEKFLIFEYSNNSFRLKFNNNMEFGEVEADVKDQTGIVGDVEFTDVGKRKIQKGEYVLEHNVVKLVKVNRNMKREECKLIILNLEAYIGKVNVNTKMLCFNGWNKSGLMSQIGKMFGLKNGYFDFYTRNELSAYRSIFIMKTVIQLKQCFE
ncbi:MAG: hypothetical protein LBC61_07870, partial [Candidatus Peribacteria bacterium]|nr:hypothetical protein [Candidatus Peribacteria bacterium]